MMAEPRAVAPYRTIKASFQDSVCHLQIDRPEAGNTINDPTSYWVPNHSPKVFVERVDTVCGIGWDRAGDLGPSARWVDVRRVVSNLGVFDFETPDHRMRLRSVHPNHFRIASGMLTVAVLVFGAKLVAAAKEMAVA